MRTVFDIADPEARRQWRALVAFEDEVAEAAGAVNAADGALVRLTARALEEGLWEGWQIHTPLQWLTLRAGVSRHKGSRILGVARRVEELPVTMTLLGEGRLSLDQAAVIARYVPAAYEASAADLALSTTVGQLVAATREYGFDTEARPDDDTTEKQPERSVSFGSDGAQWSGRIRLPADEGLVVEAALQASRERVHDAARRAAKEAAAAEGRSTRGTDAELGVPRVTWADAFVGLAKTTLATGAAGAEAATRVGIIVHLHAPPETADDHDHWQATLHDGPPLPPSLRRFLTCDATTAAVWYRDGHPVQVGRTQHDPPRRARRLIEHRDGYRCRVPGCEARLGLQVHHIVHWEDDGETVTWNLLLLCGHHHRMHHMGLLGITGNADLAPGTPGAVVFTDHHGRPLHATAPPRSDRPTCSRPFAGATGERLQKKWVQFAKAPPVEPPATATDAREPVPRC